MVLALALITIKASPAFSCSCDDFPEHRKDFRSAAAVFVGQVMDVDTGTPVPDYLKSEAAQAVKFNIEKSWKGVKDGEVTAWLHASSIGCPGFRFSAGEKYFVYAHRYKRSLLVYTFCTRTRPIARQDEMGPKEFKELNSFWFRLKSRVLFF